MPLYIEKTPITIVGTAGFLPIFIGNILAHRLVDEDTSRIMLLSTVGAELNTLQHFGHNSRKINIRGRINLTTGDNQFVWNIRLPALQGVVSVELLLTGLKLLKETKSAVLVIMNHSICYGVISKIVITDDREYPTSFDYELEIIEKDFYGLKFSAMTQRLISGLISQVVTTTEYNRERFIRGERTIPNFTDQGS